MIINSAMINSKDVLEMKLNNSIVYSAAPVFNYNQTIDFLKNTVTNTSIPNLCVGTSFLNYGASYFYDAGLGMKNYDSSSSFTAQTAHLLMDLSQCTTALKISVDCVTHVNYTGYSTSSRITFGYGTSLGNLNGGQTDLLYVSGTMARTTKTYTIPLTTINAIKNGNYPIVELMFRHDNGSYAGNNAYMMVYSIKFETV